jgi:Phytanoyl-CoA dioxygenase (PhyH)
MSSIESLAKIFWEQGYLVVEDFFDENLMDKYQEHILGHFGAAPEFLHNDEFLAKSNTDVIPWFPQQEGVVDFCIAEKDERFIDLTEAILGEGWSSLYSMVMFSKSGSKGQAWHQDCPPENQNRFNLNRLVYTMDVDDHVGGQTLVVPRSHKRGELSVGDVDENFYDQVVLRPKKSTVVFLHGHTWHRVLPVHGKHRVSTNYRCCPKGTPGNVTDVCVYRNMRYHFPTTKVLMERS